jgi:DNA polymerase-4
MAKLRALTPLVEQLSIDEAFLDVTALADPAEEIARTLQRTINSDLQFSCSLGVASNKLVAKIANNIGKAAAKRASEGQSPNAILVVPAGKEADFLAPLPSGELWGVGPKTAQRLRELGMETIGDIAAWPAEELIRLFGKHGESLSRHARGIDKRIVVTERESKSVSAETTFDRDIANREELLATLRRLSERVSASLKRKELAGTTVKLKIRWPDFATPTRQRTLGHMTNSADEIFRAVQTLFAAIWTEGQPVRLIGVGVSGFDRTAHQPTLWDVKEAMEAEAQRSEKEKRLDAALEELRSRFGESIIQRASEWS